MKSCARGFPGGHRKGVTASFCKPWRESTRGVKSMDLEQVFSSERDRGCFLLRKNVLTKAWSEAKSKKGDKNESWTFIVLILSGVWRLLENNKQLR